MLSGSRRLITLVMTLLFLAAGIFLIIMGFKNGRMQKTFIETTGVITRIERVERVGNDREYDYFTYVKYTVDGKEYESELGEYSASFKEGAELKIKYDPNDPNTIIAAGATSRVIMFAMGIVGILISLFAGFKTLRGY